MTKKKPSSKSTGTSQNEPIDSSIIDANAPTTSDEAAEGDQVDNTKLIEEAVSAGRLLIEQGKPKIEAAMVIYEKLEKLPQDVVVKAFVDGATLTTKGALTYWYNCRRKLRKRRLSSGQ
ncbi:MAG: hypothetical protein ABIY37_16300 [Devosia sp.]